MRRRRMTRKLVEMMAETRDFPDAEVGTGRELECILLWYKAHGWRLQEFEKGSPFASWNQTRWKVVKLQHGFWTLSTEDQAVKLHHEAVHASERMRRGARGGGIRFSWLFVTSPAFRLAVETPAYRHTMFVLGAMGVSRDDAARRIERIAEKVFRPWTKGGYGCQVIRGRVDGDTAQQHFERLLWRGYKDGVRMR